MGSAYFKHPPWWHCDQRESVTPASPAPAPARSFLPVLMERARNQKSEAPGLWHQLDLAQVLNLTFVDGRALDTLHNPLH